MCNIRIEAAKMANNQTLIKDISLNDIYAQMKCISNQKHNWLQKRE